MLFRRSTNVRDLKTKEKIFEKVWGLNHSMVEHYTEREIFVLRVPVCFFFFLSILLLLSFLSVLNKMTPNDVAKCCQIYSLLGFDILSPAFLNTGFYIVLHRIVNFCGTNHLKPVKCKAVSQNAVHLPVPRYNNS